MDSCIGNEIVQWPELRPVRNCLNVAPQIFRYFSNIAANLTSRYATFWVDSTELLTGWRPGNLALGAAFDKCTVARIRAKLCSLLPLFPIWWIFFWFVIYIELEVSRDLLNGIILIGALSRNLVSFDENFPISIWIFMKTVLTFWHNTYTFFSAYIHFQNSQLIKTFCMLFSHVIFCYK